MRSWYGAGVALAVLMSAAAGPAMASVSVLTKAPEDAAAVTVKAKGDGKVDDGDAIQAAIDEAGAKAGGGIVYLPSGRYRISKTLFLWPGVRIFGVGPTRPQIVLGDNTPGFQKGLSNMLIFAGAGKPGTNATRVVAGRPETAPRQVPFPPPGSVPFNKDIADANPGTFYSALSNIDFKIGNGNPAATAIRFHAAQHTFVSNAEFDIGSGMAGLYQVANEAENLTFKGGRYGILAEKPSPAWHFVLLDSTFEGQRDAAIREHENGLILGNVTMRNTPVGIEIDRGYGDWLFGKDVRFENVSKAGVIISNEENVYTQIAFEGAVATNTPTFARFRDSGKTVEGKGKSYRVNEFNYGLHLPALGQIGEYKTTYKAEALSRLPARGSPIIRPMPTVADWVSVKSLGAKGDAKTDDTAVIQKAIDDHKVVYFPAGFYNVTETLKLKPDTVLIGMHPNMTQIVLPDRTPGFANPGPAKALIESAKGGDAAVWGLGLQTNGINPRATALLWQAGEKSLVNDVKFQGGHGTNLPDGSRFNPYNATATGDADPAKRWAGQYPSLWVTNGGGGTFANIWSPSTYAYTGIYVSDTETPGRLFQASVEHHVRTELTVNRVANWEFYTPQFEEEAGEGEDTVAMEIRDSRNILVANLHGYRVTRTRKPVTNSVTVYNSENIRFRNVAVNSESGVGMCDENGCLNYLRLSKYPAENAIKDFTSGLEVRERQFAVLDIPAKSAPVAPSTWSGAGPVEKLGDGFYSASGGAVDAQGTLYFTDRKYQRIYSWNDNRKLSIVRDITIDPVNLAVDGSGALMVLSTEGRNGTVYSFRPGSPDTELAVIKPTPAAGSASARVILPANWWVNAEFSDKLNLETYEFETLAELFAKDAGKANAQEYVSPDGTLALPAFRVIAQGPADYRALKFSHTFDTYGFVGGKIGERVFVTNSSENKTYSGVVGKGGALTDLKMFANRGGEGAAVGPDGNVYVANGQVFVYAPDGKELGRIDTPERPLQVIFGGADKKTLFMISHHGLYAAKLK